MGTNVLSTERNEVFSITEGPKTALTKRYSTTKQNSKQISVNIADKDNNETGYFIKNGRTVKDLHTPIQTIGDDEQINQVSSRWVHLGIHRGR